MMVTTVKENEKNTRNTTNECRTYQLPAWLVRETAPVRQQYIRNEYRITLWIVILYQIIIRHLKSMLHVMLSNWISQTAFHIMQKEITFTEAFFEFWSIIMEISGKWLLYIQVVHYNMKPNCQLIWVFFANSNLMSCLVNIEKKYNTWNKHSWNKQPQMVKQPAKITDLFKFWFSDVELIKLLLTIL